MEDDKNKQTEEKEREAAPSKQTEGMKPFSKYKWIELGICLAAVIFGVIYLISNGGISVGTLLIVYSVCFLFVPVMRFLDMKTGGVKGASSYVSVIMWSVMAVAIIVITVLYFTQAGGAANG
jgi:hypothetical protein